MRQKDATAHCKKGYDLYNKGLTDEAILEWREALRIKPDYAEARYSLGHALYTKGFENKDLLDEAIDEPREALRINPDHAEAHCSLGRALYSKKLHDEAYRESQEALRIKPDYIDARILYLACKLAILQEGRDFE